MHYVWPFYNIIHERVKYHVSILVKCKICMFSNWNSFASSSKRIRFIFFTILWQYCFWKMRDLCFTRFTKRPILSSCRNQPFDLIYLNELTGFCMIDWFQMFFKNVERKRVYLVENIYLSVLEQMLTIFSALTLIVLRESASASQAPEKTHS